MFDLKVFYRNNTAELVDFNIPTLDEAKAVGSFYVAHTTSGHPYEVISYEIIPS